jgi:SAM-dependent methyltransferase
MHSAVSLDLGAGDGRYVLHRAAEYPTELVLAIDASHEAMRDASRRAARPARKGGLPNARFIASGAEQLPADLAGMASFVTVHFPWGSLLRAAVGEDRNGAAGIARLVAPGGLLRLLVSAAERDAAGGGVVDVDPAAVVGAYRELGMEPRACRPASADDLAAAHSTWERRLLSSGRDRRTWLIELGAASA